MCMDAPAVTDDRLMRLKDAAEAYGIGVATLRAEAERGRLAIYRIGKRLYTTPNDVREYAGKFAARARPFMIQSGIYVVGFAEFVKIGWSNTLTRRIASIQQGVPGKLTIFGQLEGDITAERTLHRRFAKYRIRGEWFRHEGELAEWIKRECQL